MRYYSPTTGTSYIDGLHSEMPLDVVPISEELYDTVIANPIPGKIRSHDIQGLPILIDPPPYLPTSSELCSRIDSAADTARTAVVGDPTRTIEYERAAAEAAQFKAAGYPAENFPRTVAAWAINGRTAQQAADSILAEAADYTESLYQIRETRLQAKELVRQAMEAGDTQQAQAIAAETIAAIQAAVAGVGNAQV
ncbi:hypothetical protein HKW90_06960 [Pseudomonas aeruginosa]|uniref:hypothetical protein n=1 Tax=Pseudomonas aeruginosa TaxID=287 RepID=UPI00068A1109|nr:hypothetical protein [Pseudomonas aeruginosa]MBF3054127.1 hypothetical protein [Pseudomonas aeruginosa]